MNIQIKPNNDEIKEFYLNHSNYYPGDAGLDLFCPETIVVSPKKMGKVNLGISCQMFNGYSTNGVSYYMYPRSSIVKTPLRLANSVGIIDRDYRGNIIACFDNISNEEYIIEKGTRLVQLCAPNLVPLTFELVDKLPETERGTGGYGSTGK
jgi:dUTP pyrophosphatase